MGQISVHDLVTVWNNLVLVWLGLSWVVLQNEHIIFLICIRYSVASIKELNVTYNAQTSLIPG